MWQRIQTLFLAIGILLNVSIFWLSIASVTLDGIAHKFSLYKLYNLESGEVLSSTILLAILCFVAILLSSITISLFKKRQIQIKLAQLALLVQTGFLVAIFFIVDSAVSSITKANNVEIEYGVGAYAALLPLLFIFLALRGIKKDEALVRAADRIR